MIDVARRAGADVVLLGNVRRSDDDAGVLISAMLFDGRTGRRIWSGVSAGRQHDSLVSTVGPAREIARAVAAALGSRRLSGSSRMLERHRHVVRRAQSRQNRHGRAPGESTRRDLRGGRSQDIVCLSPRLSMCLQ